LERAKEWSKAPWEITGEEITKWRRLVWKHRHICYVEEYNSMIRRKQNEYELERLRSGR